MLFEGLNLRSIKFFSVEEENRKIRFEREDEKDHLLLKEPHKAFINGKAFKEILKKLNQLKIEDFLEKPVAF